MGIKITKKPDFKRMSDNLHQRILQEMKQVGIDGIEEIKTRTVTKSRDAYGSALKPYSEGYRSFKSRRTKTASVKVNLISANEGAGHMMESLQSEVLSLGQKIITRIFPASNVDAEKVSWNMKTRKFFLLSREQKEDFNKRLIELLRKSFNG